jgi:hypothetical protein
MLKTVSSVANALGALNYKGTWNASTNTPTLASGVGTQGDYYVVSVAGATDLDGITNWGVGDWAAFNGSVWQRVEGGADGNFVNLDVTGAANLDGSVTINESAADKDFRVEGTTDSYLIYADADQQSVGIGISNPNSYAFNDPVKLAVGNTSGSTTLSIVSNPSSFGYLTFADGTSGASRYAGRIEYQHGTGSMYFYVNDGAQNISISSSGNLAFPSGQGIDFSATAGTGTSELLDDYEEGLATITLTPPTSGSITLEDAINSLSYTKVGRLVTLTGYLEVASVSSPVGSYVSLAGLPFAAASEGGALEYGSRSCAILLSSDTTTRSSGFLAGGGSGLNFFLDASTVSASSAFYLNFSYITA